MEPLIPPDVEEFILDRIDSIAQLEAILLLRASPDPWSEPKVVAERLYITEENAQAVLHCLCQRGLLVAMDLGNGRAYRYRPATGELREMVDRLSYYYAKHLVPVSNLVHAKARKRLEGFARAFKLSSEE